MKKENRGGPRKGAGRPRKAPTTTIRVPVELAEAIKQGNLLQYAVSKKLDQLVADCEGEVNGAASLLHKDIGCAFDSWLYKTSCGEWHKKAKDTYENYLD